MSEMQVRNRIVQAFPHLKLDKPAFMKCVDLKMVCVDVEGSGYRNGIDILEIASKGSLYLVESSSKLPKVWCYLVSQQI